MSSIEIGSAPTRRGVRSGMHLRRRWRRVDHLLSAGVGSAAVAFAIYLGVTAPTNSPVQAPAPAVVATVPQDPDAGADVTGGGPRQSPFEGRRDGGGGGRGFGRGGR